jgi:uncharacterized ferredoxin-like protein
VTISSKDAEKEAVLYAAKLMVAAARTAPKAGGRDDIKTLILAGEEKDKLAEVMRAMGGVSESNSKNVEDADAVVLIGVNFKGSIERRHVEQNVINDNWMNFNAKLIDLGIAVGSAVKTASELNIDNRIMVTVGRAAQEMGVMKADEVQGIPISVKGKNIFYDRHQPNVQSKKKPL